MAPCKNLFLQGNCFVFFVFYFIKNTKVKKIALHFCKASFINQIDFVYILNKILFFVCIQIF